MVFSIRRLKKRYDTRKNRHMSRKRMFFRGKGIHPRPPSYLPIPPPRPPSLPIPPPRSPLLPKPLALNIPIPPPPNPLFSPPSPNQFIIRSPTTPRKMQEKKPKMQEKKPKMQEKKPEPTIPQQRRSLRQLIINSEQNKKIKRR